MTDEQNRAIYCTSDRGRAEALVSEGKPTTVQCPTCGKTDTLEAAATEAVKAQFQSVLGKAFKGSKTVSLKSSGASPRWKFGAS